MSEKIEKVLSRLGNIWAKRLDDETVSEWLADWEGSLSEFEPFVLDAATTRLIRTRSKSGFPVPRELIDVCYEIIREERASKPRLKVEHSGQHRDPYALADALINCELGREAARAEPCWVLALHDFCRTNLRLPAPGEVSKLKRVAAEFEERYRDCITGNAGPQSKLFATFAETLIRRREKYRDRLIGRAAA